MKKPIWAVEQFNSRLWKWSAQEDVYLKEHCGKDDREDIAKYLNRSVSAVQSRANLLKLSSVVHPFKCAICGVLFNSQNYIPKFHRSYCYPCLLDWHEKYRTNIKFEVFSHYCGGSIPYCQCVGCRNGKENPVHIRALQLDHVNGDGAKHVDKRGKRIGGVPFYADLKRKGYPSGFQVLCANCNGPSAKGNKKQCPFHGIPH